MIQYRHGKWGFLFACSFKGSVFPKALAVAVPNAIVATCLHYALSFFEMANFAGPGDVGINVLGGFSFILGFLVVFRSQQAYARWWEGCALLQQLRGEWFNAFSNCIAFCDTSPEKKDEVISFQHRLVRMISLLYGAALSEVSEMTSNTFEFIDLDDFEKESLEYLENSLCKCEIVLQWVTRMIVEAQEAGVLKIAPPILSRVFNQLGNGIVIFQNAEKLNDFPMPFPLAQIIIFLLILHWMLTAVVVATAVEQGVWVAFISFVVIFGFWGVHFIGLELEQPFGDDANDLPLREMQVDLNIVLREVMHARARFPPRFKFQLEKHSELSTKRVSLDGYISTLLCSSSGLSSASLTVAEGPRRARLQSLWGQRGSHRRARHTDEHLQALPRKLSCGSQARSSKASYSSSQARCCGSQASAGLGQSASELPARLVAAPMPAAAPAERSNHKERGHIATVHNVGASRDQAQVLDGQELSEGKDAYTL